MLNITKEQFEELCGQYVRDVFDETQTEGWVERRSALITAVGFNEDQYEDEYDEDEEEYVGTFQEIMTIYGQNLDKTLRQFFCKGARWSISRRQWFTCYCIQQCPELTEMTSIQEDLVWKLNKEFEKWLWSGEREQGLDKIKSILGLDDCLK
jgi:hypothetical protein